MTNMIKSVSAIAIACAVGCAGTPKTAEQADELIAEANGTLSKMQQRDPSLSDTLRTAAGYAVFPEIGSGGFIVGGSHGRGVLYQGGHVVGYTTMSEASLGLIAGGQSFAELIVFHDANALAKIKHGSFKLSAEASAVALTAGASAQRRLTQGVSVYTFHHGGLMADVSVGGQHIDFKPAG